MDLASLLDKRTDLDDVQKERIHYWLSSSFDTKTRNEIEQMIIQNDPALVDAFYTTLSFGTGGLRGIMGAGSNRMNQYTISWATQGLANYIINLQIKNPKACIGYDSRKNSKEFAECAAQVLAANGFTVYLFDSLRPTPLVSYACRMFKCSTAIMITASHNPPEYNGYKVYWNDGAQVLPPHDMGIIEEVKKIVRPEQVKKSSSTDPNIELIGKEVDEAYLKDIETLQVFPQEKSDHAKLRVLYSNLHGTGITEVPFALDRYGFSQVGYVEEQKKPDGTFPTTRFPNPEEEQALKLGMNKLIKEEYDIFVATDPDCDRMGVVVNHHGIAIALTGNQVACIAGEYILKAYKEQNRLPKQSAFIKTIVTTELFRKVAESYGTLCVDVLTGFKYVAEKIRIWEETKSDIKYLFGGEESYGYLYGTFTRDKDAVTATCLISEIASHAKKEGKTLIDCLNAIYLRWGYYCEKLVSLQFEESKAGKEHMKKVTSDLRLKPSQSIAGINVATIADFLTLKSKELKTQKESPINFPVSDVLLFDLVDGTRIVIRPSETEPKIKVYIMIKEEVVSHDIEGAKARAETKAKSIASDLQLALSAK